MSSADLNVSAAVILLKACQSHDHHFSLRESLPALTASGLADVLNMKI